jgi:hypothetical protein
MDFMEVTGEEDIMDTMAIPAPITAPMILIGDMVITGDMFQLCHKIGVILTKEED